MADIHTDDIVPLDGKEAALAGWAMEMNPHQPETGEHTAWHAAWCDYHAAKYKKWMK